MRKYLAFAAVLLPLLVGCNETLVKPGPQEPTWEWARDAVIGPRCLSCHSVQTAFGGVILDTEERVRKIADVVCVAISGGDAEISRMPPAPAPLVDSDVAQEVCQWLGE